MGVSHDLVDAAIGQGADYEHLVTDAGLVGCHLEGRLADAGDKATLYDLSPNWEYIRLSARIGLKLLHASVPSSLGPRRGFVGLSRCVLERTKKKLICQSASRNRTR